MNYKFSKIKKGFSLVELLVVMAITLIMTGVLLINNNSNKSAAAVENAARVVAAQIRSLQNEALSGKQIGTQIVKEYHFIMSDDSTYVIQYKDSALNVIAAGTQSFDIAKNKVKFVSGVFPLDFHFTAPGGKVSGANTIEIRADISGVIACRTITISLSGNVSEQEVPCT
ncbi:MAG: type II secretion system protein [Candidatus Moranbacteria bacterium]|nr:type II secretion system protein [Candidatus Moranbacteria bacterium]